MLTLDELCESGNLGDILNKIENIPKDLNNFINYFESLCYYGFFNQAKLLYKISIKNNIIELNNKNQIIPIITNILNDSEIHSFIDDFNNYFESIFNIVCDKAFLGLQL